jgi:hypothetical protein
MGGMGGGRGTGGWVPNPPGHVKPDCALENEFPTGRGAGGCQVVGAGGRPPGQGYNLEGTAGSELKPGAAGDTPGPLPGQARRLAGGYLVLRPIVWLDRATTPFRL